MKYSSHFPSRSQQGFAIFTAIFLLVTLAALGAFMVSFSTVQHTTSAQDVQGSRAYQAARAGVEWGVYQVLIGSGGCGGTLPALGGVLAEFTVTVECKKKADDGTDWTYTEGTTPVTIYRITSTASQGTSGSIGYVERQVQATVAK